MSNNLYHLISILSFSFDYASTFSDVHSYSVTSLTPNKLGLFKKLNTFRKNVWKIFCIFKSRLQHVLFSLRKKITLLPNYERYIVGGRAIG